MDTATLKMDEKLVESLLDVTTQGVIGKPVDRIDGPLKVSGKAPYTAEIALPGLVHGVLVGATVGRGRIEAIDAAPVEAMPGVLAVVVDYETFLRNPAQGGSEKAPAQGVREVAYFGQPVALVVAETFEQARHGANALTIRYAREEGRFDFEKERANAQRLDKKTKARGDLDAAMAAAAASVDAVYTTPGQNSAAMELHAAIAHWDGDQLVIHGAYQMLSTNRQQIADALDLPLEKVRVVARYVGGGFGGKLGISSESIAAALAAKALDRPVKVVMSRPQVFQATVKRPTTHQRLRLAADANGMLTGVGHDTITPNLDGESFTEPAAAATQFLYGGANRLMRSSIVRMDQLLSGSMRAPGEAVGMLALEGAMDELAEQLDIDPIALHRRNEPAANPTDDTPFSTRNLIACMEEGAERFGWAARDKAPARRREGEWWIGMGMAAAARGNLLMKSSARVTLGIDGRILVETDMTDIGTGTYTILAQIAAEMLGLPLSHVDVRLGDTDLPASPGSGGSWGAASAGSSVYLACRSIREKLAQAMEANLAALSLKDGVALAGNRSMALSELVTAPITVTGTIEPGQTDDDYMQSGFGAHFVEAGVNAVTGEVRVRRMLSTFAAGRILNEKTARSQCIGGMVFGIGTALTEGLVHDPRFGQIVNPDLAEYHLPVHADVPALEVVFIDERDPAANPLFAKGLGELGISGAGAAVANAIYNACGVRVRDFPITPDRLLPFLPPP